MRILFVGDGERDAVTIPPIVHRILKTSIESSCNSWARLHGSGKGYKSKLLYALAKARSGGMSGLVATIDRDTADKGERLKRLKAARKTDRSKRAPLPTALGEADPHCEAWLLDDESAVRDALALAPVTPVPTVGRTSNPKDELDLLIASSPVADQGRLTLLGRIAEKVDPNRCLNAKTTGFRAFVKDIKDEFRASGGGRDDE